MIIIKHDGSNNREKKEKGVSHFFTILVFLAFALFLQVMPAHSSRAADCFMELRVGLSLDGNHLELSFGDDYRLCAGYGDECLPLSAGRYRLTNAGGGIEIYDPRGGNRLFWEGPLFLQPVGAVLEDCSFQLHNALHGRGYRGALEIISEGDGLLAVNILDLETYLRGVLPAEMPALWGADGGREALKSQAVAARTFALYYREARRHSKYHLCDQEHCQVYKGKDVENLYTDQAIKETGGEILTYGGQIIESFYHASNGGFTEFSHNVWHTSLPYFDSVPDPYDDPGNPLGLPGFKCCSPWTATVSRRVLSDRLAEKGYNIGEIERIDIESCFVSGRVEEITLQGRGGRRVSLAKDDARAVLDLASQLYTLCHGSKAAQLWAVSAGSGPGFEKKESFPVLEGKWTLKENRGQMKGVLRGNDFFVRGDRISVPVSHVTAENLTFEGRGRGHGIGLSQYGAYNRSRAGHGYREILSFYYPGAEIANH